ncbi:hypothetical protein Spla01_03268 [Streptomyces platensis]|uniref:Uncharacterized protein n=1 Tax=Streptomyces platensis TaxID=58346 RepID=A0ABX3Y3Q6_STRPT|nr:hypothetical protein BG653_00807 [Streptomyces platensis]
MWSVICVLDRLVAGDQRENRAPVDASPECLGNEGKDEFEDVDKSIKKGRTAAEQGAEGRNETTTDEVRDVFG